MASYKPYIKTSKDSITELPVDASTLGGVDASVLQKEYEDSANSIQLSDLINEFSASIGSIEHTTNSIKITPNSSWTRIRFKINKVLTVGKKYTFSVNVSRSAIVSILHTNTDLYDGVMDNSGTKIYYQNKSYPSGTITTSFEAKTTNLYLGVYINEDWTNTEVCVISNLFLTEYVDQYAKDPKYLPYNASKNISNSEAEYLKFESNAYGNLWKNESVVTINSGADKWVYVDHYTLVSWGLKEGEVYTIRAFDCPVSAQYIPGWYTFHDKSLSFRFSSSSTIRFGADTLSEDVTFTYKVNLFRGPEVPLQHQPYSQILTQNNTRRIYAQVESDYVYNNQSSLGVSSVETFIQQVIKRICVVYPNHLWYTFYFSFGYDDKQYMAEVFIYSTLNVYNGFPQYAFGEATGFYGNKIQFSINQYTWALDYKLNDKSLTIYGSVNGGSNTNSLNFRHLDGQNFNNGDYDLFLQYNHPDHKVWFGKKGAYIGEKGTYYSGTSEQAKKLSYLANIVSSDKSNYPWHRIASIPVQTGNFFDATGTYYLQGYYADAPYYIFRIEFRTHDIKNGINGRFRIKVLETNSSPSNLMIATYFSKVSADSNAYQVLADIFVKVGTYARMLLSRLSAPDWSYIAYYNSEELYGGVRPDRDDKGEVYKGINGTTDEYASYKLHGIDKYTIITAGVKDDSKINAQSCANYVKSTYGETDMIEFLKKTIKKICVDYDNLQHNIFYFVMEPTSASYVELDIYNTYDKDSTTGLPRYCYGKLINYGLDRIYFNIDNFKFSYYYESGQGMTFNNVPKLYNHFLQISFTKGGTTYNCRVNILSTVSTKITTLNNLEDVCLGAKNIKRTGEANQTYNSMPAEGIPNEYETSTAHDKVVFKLMFHYNPSVGSKLYLYYIIQNNGAGSNFNIIDSSSVSVTLSDKVTTIYGKEE